MKLLAQASQWEGLEKAPGSGVADVATVGSLVSVMKNIITSLVAVVGVVLFIMLIIGGVNFLFSGGDQKKLEKAKGTITSALIGFLLFIGSYLILRLIQSFTGVNVTSFGINMSN